MDQAWMNTMCPSPKGIAARLSASLHLEAGPIPLESDCMKFQPFLGGRPADFPTCKRP